MDKYQSRFTGVEIDARLAKVNQEFTSEEKEKLAGLTNYDDTEVWKALETRVVKVEGKELSSNDFTDDDKSKLNGLHNYDDTAINQAVEELQTSKANASDVYTKTETDSAITAKVSEIVAGAPEEFDTLKEMSDWLTKHEDSAAAMNTAIQKNATDIANCYTKTESDNNYLGKTETAAAAVLDGAGGNIAEQFAEDTNALGIVKTTLGSECKNYVQVNCEPVTKNGVTLTPNNDGSITINGTSSTSTSILGYHNLRTGATDINSQYDRYQLLKPGKYIISRTSAPNVRIQVCAMTSDETTSIITIGNSTTSDAVITIGEEHIYTWARLYLANSVSQVYDNITVYPMIRRAEVTDGTYEPYKPSLQAQIDELAARLAALETVQ